MHLLKDFDERITGHANALLRRGPAHRRDYLRTVLAVAAAQANHKCPSC